jgi:hypothetical protein
MSRPSIILGLIAAAAAGALIAQPAVAQGPDNQDPLAAESALASAQARWAALGAVGVYRDEGGGTLVVDVPDSKVGGFRLGSLNGVGMPAVVRAVPFDSADLDAALGRLTALIEDPSMQGESTAFFFDPSKARIYVSTTISRMAIEEALSGLEYLLEYHLGGAMMQSRCADTSPFWGGAALETCSGHPFCTTAFTVVINSSGARALTTAGHCYSNNQQPKTPTGLVVGTVANAHCAGQTDAELIVGNSYGATVYLKGMAGTGWPINGAADPTVGGTYWVSGATTFEQTVVVTSTSASLNYGCGTITNMIAYQTPGTGTCPTQTGDSGAPLVLRNSSTAWARGIHNAIDLAGTHCYATKWSSVASGLGVSIATWP